MREGLLAELMELTPAERLELAQDLWDSVGAPDLPVLSEAELDEIERDLAAHRADPSSSVPWEEVLAELRSPEK